MRPLHAQSGLIFFLLLASSMSNASTLENACKYIAANSRRIVGYHYCIKFFQADKRSATADKLGLTGIAMKFTRAAATHIGHRIAALKASEKDEGIKPSLNACAELYSLTEYRLGDAIEQLASGNTQDLAVTLGGVYDTPDECEDEFREDEVDHSSVLATENSELTKKALIALYVYTWKD